MQCCWIRTLNVGDSADTTLYNRARSVSTTHRTRVYNKRSPAWLASRSSHFLLGKELQVPSDMRMEVQSLFSNQTPRNQSRSSL